MRNLDRRDRESRDECRLSRVAQRLQTSQSGMTGKLDRLERHGFIQRSPDPEDRRAIRLWMTDSGRALIDEAFTIH